MNHRTQYIAFVLFCLLAGTVQAKKWGVKNAPLLTPWSENIDPQNVLPEYPRPMMVRDEWRNLNGIWEFQQGFEGDKVPFNKRLSDEILVPFPWESPLSGIRQQFSSFRGWYRKKVAIPQNWSGQRVLLHFGAVDWEAAVYVNGHCLGKHQGGFDAFSFDITKYLVPKGEQEIIVSVYDPTDTKPIAIGKQWRPWYDDPQWCLYTPNSGIWQTVWLEAVPETYITDIKIIPDLDKSRFDVKVTSSEVSKCPVRVNFKAEDVVVATAVGETLRDIPVHVSVPRLWSPADPYLYDVKIELLDEDKKVVDRIESYAGMRKISVEVFDKIPRLCLNGEPLYQHGPLDQGYWPDGIFTAPSDDALRWDIENIKDWGFNMIRKHMKIEPQRWYYHCDKLGILVWQDMSCSNGDLTRSETDKVQFETELSNMVYQHWSHPSIIMWTVFNEHWGLYDVDRLTENVMSLDPSRLVMGNSGIDAKTPHVDYEVGHIKDNHSYLPPTLPLISSKRATVNGEYGALGYFVPRHSWSDNGKYMHDYYKDQPDKKLAATNEYVEFMDKIYGYIAKGLSATVYTQWTDVENEVNGLYTYDRKIIKLDKERVKSANMKCYQIPLAPAPSK